LPDRRSWRSRQISTAGRQLLLLHWVLLVALILGSCGPSDRRRRYPPYGGAGRPTGRTRGTTATRDAMNTSPTCGGSENWRWGVSH